MSVSATVPVGDEPTLTDSPPPSKRALWIVFWIFPGFFGLFGVVFFCCSGSFRCRGPTSATST